MLGGKRGIKRLDAKAGRVPRELIRRHERDGAESPDVSVVERSAVVERELDRRVAPFLWWQLAGVDEQRAGEARLNHEPLAGGQIEDDELGPTPDVLDRRVP